MFPLKLLDKVVHRAFVEVFSLRWVSQAVVPPPRSKMRTLPSVAPFGCIFDSVAKITLGSFLHLGQHHGRDLLRRERLCFILVLHFKLLLASDVSNSERPVLHVALDVFVVEVAANEPLGVEHGVSGVDGHQVLGCIADETFGVIECHVTQSGPVALVVSDDFNLEM